MSERALLIALTAGAGLLLAAGAFVAAVWLDAFEPCRVPYRLPPSLEGSLACQAYYALVLFSKLLSLAACGLAVLAGILFSVRRRKRS
jgi:hypothetical protein